MSKWTGNSLFLQPKESDFLKMIWKNVLNTCLTDFKMLNHIKKNVPRKVTKNITLFLSNIYSKAKIKK